MGDIDDVDLVLMRRIVANALPEKWERYTSANAAVIKGNP
jgi:hypothetical protein